MIFRTRNILLTIELFTYLHPQFIKTKEEPNIEYQIIREDK